MEASEVDGRPERPLIERAIVGESIRGLGLPAPITVPQDATLLAVVETMRAQHIGCVLVTGPQGKLAGIFTERDLMTRVALGSPKWEAERVADYMTPDPETLRPDDRIAWALKLMHIGGYRHVPLTDEEGRPVGVVSIKDIVDFIVDLFPAPVLNLPPDPRRKPDCEFMGGGED
ncbi:MAG TPA: CBS domain-containing protein [Myxococcales bacterium]|nr:CBS domain-containing protein [Myxococcales bacterium]